MFFRSSLGLAGHILAFLDFSSLVWACLEFFGLGHAFGVFWPSGVLGFGLACMGMCGIVWICLGVTCLSGRDCACLGTSAVDLIS